MEDQNKALQCTHCAKDYDKSKFKVSAPIPESINDKFVLCSSCGNVMIGIFSETNELQALSSTPQNASYEAVQMARQAMELFRLAGLGDSVKSVGFTPNGRRYDSDRLDEAHIEQLALEAIREQAEDGFDAVDQNDNVPADYIPGGFFGKVKAQFIKLLKKAKSFFFKH